MSTLENPQSKRTVPNSPDKRQYITEPSNSYWNYFHSYSSTDRFHYFRSDLENNKVRMITEGEGPNGPRVNKRGKYNDVSYLIPFS